MRPRSPARPPRPLALLGSVELAVGCMAALMGLVVACTLAQVHLGTFGAVDAYIRRLFIYGTLPGTDRRIPLLPGGGLVGLVLAANLAAGLLLRPEWRRTRPGLLLSHLGVLVLVGGEFVTASFAEETIMPIEVGASRSWAESQRRFELALVDVTAPATDRVYAIPASRLRPGAEVDDARLPFRVAVEAYAPNARLERARGGGVEARPVPAATADDEADAPAATVLLADRTRLLVSADLEPAPFMHRGRRYTVALRPARRYLPFTLALTRFTHEIYPGTDIPRNFASLVRLTDAARGEDRDCLISMNHPLRYRGRTFYQSSFGKGDRLSIFQVVRNPGWLIPYAACAMVAAGLAFHFIGMLRSGVAGKAGGHGRATAATRLAHRATRASRAIPWVVGGGAALALAISLRPPGLARGMEVEAFGGLPVLSNGRIKPLDTVARTALLQLRGKQSAPLADRTLRPVEWLLDTVARPETADAYRVFLIDDPDVVAMAGLGGTQGPRGREFAYRDLQPAILEIERQGGLADPVPPRARSRFQSGALALRNRVRLYQKLQHSFGPGGEGRFTAEIAGFLDAVGPGVKAVRAHQTGGTFDREALARLGFFFKRYQALADVAEFLPLPPRPGEARDDWRTAGEGLLKAMQEGEPVAGVVAYATLLEAYADGDAAMFNVELAAWRRELRERVPGPARRAGLEVLFNRARPFGLGMTLYVLACLAGFVSFLWRPAASRRAALALLASAFAIHTLGLAARILLQWRPPVTNLYSSAVFVGWVAAGLGVWLEARQRDALAAVVAGAIGFATLIVAHHLALEGDSMEMMRAVLDSNFWLGTHVVAVTTGYAATFLAGALAAAYLLRAALDRGFGPGPSAALARQAYGVVCFALFFSFVGTVLGGIWADQSWGRFWGWDPKENGALLIVLWNAIILHARWGKLAGERGIMVMTVFGNVITSLSWFGVNMLGIGLHSYGWMDRAFWWLAAFVFSQGAIMLLGWVRPRRA